jgi:hypothetical protein
MVIVNLISYNSSETVYIMFGYSAVRRWASSIDEQATGQICLCLCVIALCGLAYQRDGTGWTGGEAPGTIGGYGRIGAIGDFIARCLR